MQPKINPKMLVAGVKKLVSKEQQRILPTAKGGEQATLIQYRTDIYSHFTVPESEGSLLYSAENWVRVKLTLETAGPVAVGNNAQIGPVLSGKGRLLDTGVEYEIYMARGSSLYVVSESVNRLSVTVEPIPWMEQISGEIVMTARTIAQVVQNVGSAITSALALLTGQPAKPVDKPPPGSSPVPQIPRNLAARLTRVRLPGKTR